MNEQEQQIKDLETLLEKTRQQLQAALEEIVKLKTK
jgi:hypothetical protein